MRIKLFDSKVSNVSLEQTDINLKKTQEMTSHQLVCIENAINSLNSVIFLSIIDLGMRKLS